MSTSPGRRGVTAARVASIAGLVSFALVSCHPAENPGPGSAKYARIVSAFYGGVAALDAGDAQHAPQRLERAARLAPEEPAAWADLALSDLRSGEIDKAQADLKKARDLAPSNGEIIALDADIDLVKGDFDGAVDLFKKAIAEDPGNLKIRYALYQTVQRQSATDSGAGGEQKLKDMIKIRPGNLALLLELARVGARNGETSLVKQLLTDAGQDAKSWPDDVQTQFKTTVKAAGAGASQSVPQVMMLRNELSGFEGYQDSLAELQVPEGAIADPISRFIVLQNPPDTPAPADTTLTFTDQSLSVTGQWNLATSIWLDGNGTRATVLANDQELLVTSPSSSQTLPLPAMPTKWSWRPKNIPLYFAPTVSSVLPVDLDDDGFVDIVYAGVLGLRIYHQTAGKFVDVTSAAKLPGSITSGQYTGVWAADLYTAGAVDVILGTNFGPPIVLRNNDNGTFTVTHPFAGVNGLKAFCWVDLDGDGIGDAALIDGDDHLRIFHNNRSGSFEEWPAVPGDIANAAAISAADIDHSERFSLVLWSSGGPIETVSMSAGGKWIVRPIATAAPPGAGARLLLADLDNNGALDLIATSSLGTQVWLADQKGAFQPLVAKVDGTSVSLDDDGVTGRLNLIGMSHTGLPTRYANSGTKNYHWQQIRLQAVSSADGKNNSFGVGGHIALRAALLFADQPIDGPVTHFGLGTHSKADFAQIQWPNGLPQAEFNLTPDSLAQIPEVQK